MDITWRALPAWPYPRQPAEVDRFEAGFTVTTRQLRSEIEAIDGRNAIIGVVTYISHIAKKGTGLLADGKVLGPGAEVSFDIPAGTGWQRVTFHTDARRSWNDHRANFNSNLRAIALGLEALRAVNRYGITTTGQQYAGFAQLTAGGPDPDRGRILVDRAGGLREALFRHHPDQGGEDRDFIDVQAFRALSEGGSR